MKDLTYIIKFEDTSHAGANIYAQDLRDFLHDASKDIKITIKRDDPSTMDFGGTLVLVLGTPAIIAIANGLAAWLRRFNTASITIETDEGKVIANNITSKNAD